MINIEKSDYRAILKEELLQKKEQYGSRFTFSRMASRAKVQKAYLSRALNGSGHLNSDQVFLACEYLGLSALETDFISTMLEENRAAIPARKTRLGQQLQKMRNELSRAEEHIDVTLATPSQETLETYYRDPIYQIIHICLSIERYALDPDLLARDLRISKDSVIRALEVLQRLGIIVHGNGRYLLQKDFLHLPEGSPILTNFRAMSRLKAVEKIQHQDPNDFHFMVTFSSNRDAFEKIRKKFNGFLSEIEDIVRDAPSEDTFQLNFDLLNWTSRD